MRCATPCRAHLNFRRALASRSVSDLSILGFGSGFKQPWVLRDMRVDAHERRLLELDSSGNICAALPLTGSIVLTTPASSAGKQHAFEVETAHGSEGGKGWHGTQRWMLAGTTFAQCKEWTTAIRAIGALPDPAVAATGRSNGGAEGAGGVEERKEVRSEGEKAALGWKLRTAQL